MSDVLKKLEEILSAVPSASSTQSSLTVIGMVRAGPDKTKTLQFALGDSGQWVSIPRDLVQSVKQLGTLAVEEKPYHVVELTMQRPEKDNWAFDMLVFTLKESSRLFAARCGQATEQPSGCSCSCEKSGSTMVPRMRRIPNARPATWKCFLCWIYTGGGGADWCYFEGNC